MLKIYLIRHGQTEWNLLKKMQGSMNSDLTTEGKEQAMSLGFKLKSISFDKIYSSSITRAIQTSNLIFPNQPIEYSSLLSEISMGEWEGKTYSEIEASDSVEWDNFFNNPFNYTPNGNGESFEQLENRLREFIVDKDLLNQDGTIAIVSHRITLRMLISILLNDKNLFSEIDLKPTSLSIIEIDHSLCTVEHLNDTTHY